MQDVRNRYLMQHGRWKRGQWERTARVTCLQHIQCSSHVTFAQLHQAVRSIWSDLDIFFLDHNIHQLSNIWLFQWAEPESRTPGQQRWRKLVGVICDDAEPGVSRVFLHDSSECHLSYCCHGIGFVEDNEFEGAEGGSVPSFG